MSDPSFFLQAVKSTITIIKAFPMFELNRIFNIYRSNESIAA